MRSKAEQLTLTPEEFSKKYGWKNDPSKAESGKQKVKPKPEGEKPKPEEEKSNATGKPN